MEQMNPFQSIDSSEWGDVGVRFTNVHFGKSQGYVNGAGETPTVLIADWENEHGGMREDQILSIGNGFVAVDGGAAVEHERARFNKGDNLAFGKGAKATEFLDSLVACDVDALVEHGQKVGGPRTAAFWEGLTVHVKEEERVFGKPDENGQRKSYRQPIATALYGWDVDWPEEDEEEEEAPVPVKKAPGKKAPGKRAPEPQPQPAAELVASDFNLEPDIFDVLVILANSSPDYETFISAAYEMPEIADVNVQAAVDDDENGIWGKCRG